MAMLYSPDGTMRDVQGPLSLAAMQKLVGGYIEMVTLGYVDGKRLALIVDEEGKLKGKPINNRATALWHSRYPVGSINDVIVGDALLVIIEHEGEDEEQCN